MPTSEIDSVPAIVHEICRLQPKSILDLGCGCGKYGVLAREYLDGAQGRTAYDEWTVKIDAVEGFQKYLGPLHVATYDNVFIEDFAGVQYHGYDLVLMIDSLEHLTPETGKNVLTGLLQRNKHVIVSVPWGANYLEQGPVFGNDFETHRTKWDPRAFVLLGGRELYCGVCAVYSIPGRG